jgi:hypothetical protein
LPARSVWGWEAARPCVSKEAKPAKIVSLIEKIFCARPSKNVSIFAGFVRRQAASLWVGLPPCGRQLSGVPLEKGSSGVVKLHQNKNTPSKGVFVLVCLFDESQAYFERN